MPIPKSCRSRAIRVPYLGLAPKYDRLGFAGFPERCDIDAEKLIRCTRKTAPYLVGGREIVIYQELISKWLPRTGPAVNKATIDAATIDDEDIIRFRADFYESFLQEWLWFGLMHEFELACGVQMDLDQFIRSSDDGQFLNTEPLLGYVRAVLLDVLHKNGVPLDLKVGDWVRFRAPAILAPTIERNRPFRVKEKLGNMRFALENEPLLDRISVSFLIRANVAHLHRRLPQEVSVDRDSSCNTRDFSDSLCSIPTYMLATLVHEVHITTAPADSSQELFARLPTSRRNRHVQCLEDVQRILRTVNAVGIPTRDPLLLLDTALSTRLLCDSLLSALSEITGRWFEDQPNVPYEEIFVDRMKMENWCAGRVSMSSNVHLQYITSLLPSNEPVSHRDCPLRGCCNRPRELDGQRAKHRENCIENCSIVTVDETKLVGILKSGGTPGIVEVRDNMQNTSYEIVDITGRSYVAISHVWSHGLGNPTANALPVCQIKLLFQLIKAISTSDVVMWIDTLSVPIVLEYKRLAILRLRDVYKKASKVLVVDRHLLQTGPHWLERRLQLLCSEWMRRLWTLQEGRLPLVSDLYIQFQGEAISVAQLLSIEKGIYDTSGSEIFTRAYITSTSVLADHFVKKDNISNQFIDLARDLGHRSVSVASDEPICLATLLGLALEDFSPFPTMVDIYRSLLILPQDLLFFAGPRLKIPGFRWAPSTFLESDSHVGRAAYETARLTDNGLCVRKDCILLTGGIEFRRVEDDSAEFYFIECSGTYEWAIVLSPGDHQVSRCLRDAAIILQVNEPDWKTAAGVLVSSLIMKDGTYHCCYELCLPLIREAFDREGGNPNPKVHQIKGNYLSQVNFCVD